MACNDVNCGCHGNLIQFPQPVTTEGEPVYEIDMSGYVGTESYMDLTASEIISLLNDREELKRLKEEQKDKPEKGCSEPETVRLTLAEGAKRGLTRVNNGMEYETLPPQYDFYAVSRSSSANVISRKPLEPLADLVEKSDVYYVSYTPEQLRIALDTVEDAIELFIANSKDKSPSHIKESLADYYMILLPLYEAERYFTE